MTETFADSMIRSYVPYQHWNAFDNDDIKDIDEVIEYARGLVIKDSKTAEKFETDYSMSTADRYIRAKDNTLDPKYGDYEKNLFIETYNETNKYYKGLYERYGIDYYTARKANDLTILKATNNTLDKWHKSIFETSYNDALNYYHKVLFTHAWDNQKYDRQFFQEYIIFMTVQRYIDKEMDGYFNVDTYNKRQLKNGFISYGLDYFDIFPIEYQRRTYKVINDMIRNKGSNRVFDIIRDIFSFNNVIINQYKLGRSKDIYNNDDLIFYKTNIDKLTDIFHDQTLSYDDVTKDDPYWRADKEEIISVNQNNSQGSSIFNVMNTKYISVDIMLNILKNSQEMSYFWSLLNGINNLNNKTIQRYADTHNITFNEASKLVGNEDFDFNFYDRNISSEPINIFNAIVALILLVLERMDWNDTINHHQGSLKRVYGFNFDSDVLEFLEDCRDYVLWYNKKKFDSEDYANILSFLNRFHLQNFNRDNNTTKFDYIEELYNSHIDYDKELRSISMEIENVNGSQLLLKHLNENNLYAALDYLNNEILDYDNRKINIGLINDMNNVKLLLSNFMTYKISNGYYNEDFPYQWLLDHNYLMDELDQFVKKLNNNGLSVKYSVFKLNKNISNLKSILLSIQPAITEQANENQYSGVRLLKSYSNLNAYLDTYIKYTTYDKNKFSMEDFANIYRYDDGIRKDLENIINTTSNPKIYNSFKKIWENKFVSNLDMTPFMGYSSYKAYLKDKDPNLYYYTQLGETYSNAENFDKYSILRDRIFELTSDINNHLELDEYDFFLENNFIGIEEYVKRYIYILIQVFKAYTVDTIWAQTDLKLDNKFDNSIRVLDDINIFNARIAMRDDIDLEDTINTHESLFFSDKDGIKLSDNIKITSNEK